MKMKKNVVLTSKDLFPQRNQNRLSKDYFTTEEKKVIKRFSIQPKKP